MGNVRVRLLKIVYAEGDLNNLTTKDVLVSIGDSLRAQDWAQKEFPEDKAMQEERAGLYGVYLAAKRQSLPHTAEGTYLDWLDHVTVEDDEADVDTDAEAAEPGESSAPQSDS